jgi:hypothetical protein
LSDNRLSGSRLDHFGAEGRARGSGVCSGRPARRQQKCYDYNETDTSETLFHFFPPVHYLETLLFPISIYFQGLKAFLPLLVKPNIPQGQRQLPVGILVCEYDGCYGLMFDVNTHGPECCIPTDSYNMQKVLLSFILYLFSYVCFLNDLISVIEVLYCSHLSAGTAQGAEILRMRVFPLS